MLSVLALALMVFCAICLPFKSLTVIAPCVALQLNSCTVNSPLLGLGLTVAPHAFFNRRYSGVRRHVYEAVAVLTGKLIVFAAGMDFVTEPYRLNGTLAAALSAEVEKI